MSKKFQLPDELSFLTDRTLEKKIFKRSKELVQLDKSNFYDKI